MLQATAALHACKLPTIKKLAPLPGQGIKELRLSKEAALLFSRLGALYPVSAARKPHDPHPWTARTEREWSQDCDFTPWEWRKATRELLDAELIERVRGLWAGRCLSFLRPSKIVRERGWKGWLADREKHSTASSPNPLGGTLPTDGENISRSYNKEQPGLSAETHSPFGERVPSARASCQRERLEPVIAGEDLFTPADTYTPHPPKPPAPQFPVSGSFSVGFQVSGSAAPYGLPQHITVHPGAPPSARPSAKEGAHAMKAPKPPQKSPKAASGLPVARKSVSALAQEFQAKQQELAASEVPLAPTNVVVALEQVFRASCAKRKTFSPPWSVKTRMLMKRFAAALPDPKEAPAVLACALDDWEAFRAYAKENFDGWKLSAQPVADQVALQIEALANWRLRKITQAEEQAAILAKQQAQAEKNKKLEATMAAEEAKTLAKLAETAHKPITLEELQEIHKDDPDLLPQPKAKDAKPKLNLLKPGGSGS